VDWPRFVELVSGCRRIALTTHIRPDCDAVGSELALAAVLERLAKEVVIANAFPLPRNLTFMDRNKKLKRLGEEIGREEIEKNDLLLVLDTTAWAQLGNMAEVIRTTRVKKAVMDHHVSGDDLDAELFKDTTAEATGRLVIEAAEHLGVELTLEIARPAFAALATDTGWFRFPSVTSETYDLAAKLVRAGAVPHEIYRELYENDSQSRLNLIGKVMARTVTELDGRLVHTYICRDDFEQTGAVPSDSEDIVNMTLSIGGTEVAVILVEQVNGGFKISFRSRSHVDCSRLAEQFGGGGHKAAAGAFLKEPLDSARAKVLEAVRAAMQ
jgi:phosphoesterase RecJ-like protein